jgi:hypothetical protein
VYVAKLPTSDRYAPGTEITKEDAVHEAILDAIDSGHITENFGRFWVVEGYILIDEKTEVGE